MKFGMCTTPQEAARLSPGTLDYLEMNLSQIAAMTAQELADTKQLLGRISLSAEVANCFFPAEISLCGENYRPEKVAEYTKRALEKAALLGIHTCVLGSGNSRRVREEYRAQELQQLEEAIRVVGTVAAEYHTLVVLEPLNRGETNTINTVEEGAALCCRINLPQVRLLADYYHVACEGEPLSLYGQYADLLSHLHFANPKTRQYPLPGDGCDYAPAVREIKNSGYTGRISIEGNCPGGFVSSAEACLDYVRGLFL